MGGLRKNNQATAGEPLGAYEPPSSSIKRAGRPGVSSLGLPPTQYRPSLTMADFETKEEARVERDLRIKLLGNCIHSGLWGRRAERLSARLATQSAHEPLRSMACPLYVRQLRERVVGHLHQVLNDKLPERCAFVTIVRLNWAIHPAELDEVDLDRWKRAVRKNISDELQEKEGWLFVWFEASYDPKHQCYQFHLHGIATGAYIAAIKALRSRKPYRPWADEVGIPDCQRTIVCKSVQLEDLPRPIGYSLKSFWKLRNAGPAVRLQGDEHTRALLFLDNHRPEDLCMLVNISVKGGRLVAG